MFQEFLLNKAKIIEKTDPDRIYIENIRSFFNIPHSIARTLCEIAVRQGLFKKKIAIECGNHNCKRVIKTYSTREKLPQRIICDICEAENKDIYEFTEKEYRVVEYYKLVRKDGNK